MSQDAISRARRAGLAASAVRLVLIAALLISPLLLAARAYASPESEFQQARRYYDQLLQSDPRVADLMEWERAASELLTYLHKYRDTEHQPKAFLTLGQLYEKTYRERRFRTGLTRAAYFYETLAKKHKGHRLADDALLLLGDLRRDAFKDEIGARAAYFEILDVYPDGDKEDEARKRLGPDAPAKPAAGTTTVAKPTPAPTAAAVEGADDEEEGILAIFSKPDVGKEGKEIYADSRTRTRPVIVIDPGHGGIEEGAHGVDGVLEKDVVLAISLMLDELLRERLRARTVLTRTTDIDVPLQERTQIANKHNADLFISIHANASEYKTARGIETYYLDNTDDKSSLKLAKRENEVMGDEPLGDLDFILSDLIQNAKLEESISLAHYIQNSLHSTISRYYKETRNLGVKKAPFYVLVGAHMPCVLVEVSFIDHPVEGRRLISRRYQKLVAAALYEGVREFFESRQ